MSSLPDVPFRDQSTMSDIASRFLARYWPSGAVPVNIEEILDVALGIHLITIPNPWQSFEIDGYIAPAGTELYLDDWMYWNRPTRARFTIARELGHLYVHRDVLDAAGYSNSDGYRRFLYSLSPDYIDRLKLQANDFAGLALVPDDGLDQIVSRSAARCSACS